jgi:hypothetical protein
LGPAPPGQSRKYSTHSLFEHISISPQSQWDAHIFKFIVKLEVALVVLPTVSLAITSTVLSPSDNEEAAYHVTFNPVATDVPLILTSYVTVNGDKAALQDIVVEVVSMVDPLVGLVMLNAPGGSFVTVKLTDVA